MKNVHKVDKETSERKSWSYKAGDTNLSFTLRTDIRKELEDFRSCLLNALGDIEEQLGHPKVARRGFFANLFNRKS